MDPGEFGVGIATAKQSKQKVTIWKIDGQEITCLNIVYVELLIFLIWKTGARIKYTREHKKRTNRRTQQTILKQTSKQTINYDANGPQKVEINHLKIVK